MDDVRQRQLAEWESVRVPTQAAIIRELVDAGGGYTSVKDVQREIERVHGVEPSAAQVANLAVSVEARVRAGKVVDLAVASSVSVPAAAMAVSVEEIPGLPEASKPLLAEILSEPPGDPDSMRQRVSAHLARFEEAARHNEFLDVREARQLAANCHRLIDLMTQAASPGDRSLLYAAAAYFVMPVDAEADLEIGGLDDDLAVFNAIVTKLGRVDLVIAL